jgi:hypothetical protein
MKVYWRRRCIAPLILNLDTGQRLVVSSCCGYFTPGDRYPLGIENEVGLAPELVWTVLDKNASVSAEKQIPGSNQFTLQLTLYHIFSL